MDLIVPDSDSGTQKLYHQGEQLQDAVQLREKITRNMINFDKLKSILIETKSVIAGSYIIKALLQEEWATDMDVWCKQPALRNLTMPAPFYEYFVKSLGYRFKRIPMEPKHDYTRLEKYVTDIVSLVHPNPGFPKIQIITTKKSHIDVIRSFDLNVCRVFYDPTTKPSEIQQVGDAFEMINARKMGVTQEAQVEQSMFEWVRTLKRIMKYRRRGFHFSQASDLDKLIQGSFEPDYAREFTNAWNCRIFANFDIYDETIPFFFKTHKGKKDNRMHHSY